VETISSISIRRYLFPGSVLLTSVRILAILGLIGSLGLGLSGRYWLPAWLTDAETPTGMSIFTLASLCLIILFTEFRLTNLGIYNKFQSIILSFLYANAFVWTYELIYHYSFPADLTIQSLPSMILVVVQILPAFVLARYMGLRNKIGIIFGIAFCLLWVVWIITGFTQFWHLAHYTHQFFVLPNVYWGSFALNYGTKLSLAGIFIGLILA
jgi:hypothetical protein